jgi:RimJ/RimL family protein N-acetyltransferase
MKSSSPQPTLIAVTARGEKINLRLPELRDADGLVIACGDPETTRWTTILGGYNHERALGFINEYAPGWWQRGQGGCWVITDAEDTYSGQIDLRIFESDPKIADVGFLTAPHARGRGYMTAALRVVAEYGLRELGLQRVEWKAHVGNVASRLVAERAGFQYEGVMRNGCKKGDTYVDSWVAALVQGDLA